ncbi:MAG: hypothetical protein AB7I48_18200 [Planctomycetaceae bacterium]
MSRNQTSKRCRRTGPRCALLLTIFVGISGCFGGTSENTYENYRARKTAFLDIVKQLGGSAQEERFSLAGYEGTAWKIDLSGAKFEPELGMELLAGIDEAGYIAAINFSGSSLLDEHLLKFDADGSSFVVMDLDLSNTAVTDASIDKLENFMALRNVKLSGTKVSKAAVDRWLNRRRQIKEIPAMFLNPKITM